MINLENHCFTNIIYIHNYNIYIYIIHYIIYILYIYGGFPKWGIPL